MRTQILLPLIFTFLSSTISLIGQNPVPVGNDTLDINNVGAKINCDGTLFSTPNDGSFYRVPKQSGLGTIFNLSLWFAGLDFINQVHLSGGTLINEEFQPGPVSSNYTGTYAQTWNKVWKLTRTQVQYHNNHWNQPGYVPIPAIAGWPGNGDTLNGQLPILAPFKDLNNDGIYNPLQGDYPEIPGDQAIYFIYNDDQPPTIGLSSLNMKFEIRGMAYAFDCPMDSALMFTTFYHYDIINRSNFDYFSCAIGLYVDPDVGYSWDDYMGSDVARSSFYAYNGLNYDGNAGNAGYGQNPPMQAFTVLGGPFLPSDSMDNPAYVPGTMNNCGFPVNGINFGDNVIDNERIGLTGFNKLYNSLTGPMHDPTIAEEFMYYLNGQWLDGVHFSYGGSGHPAAGATGPDCNFLYPYDSDPCNWGTNGIQPAGFSTGAGGSGPYWTEGQAGNVPADTRGLGVIGPFSIARGQVQSLDLAMIYGRNYADTNAFSSLSVTQERIDKIRGYFQQSSTPCGNWAVSLDPKPIKPEKTLRLYPNPARNTVNVECLNFGKNPEYTVFNLIGLEVSRGILQDNSVNTLNISDLNSGVYFLRVQKKTVKKFVVNP